MRSPAREAAFPTWCSGLAFILVVVLARPVVVFAGRVSAATVRLVLGRWTVIAEARGESRLWRARGRRGSRALVAGVAEALAIGANLPAGGSIEGTVTTGLTEADVARRTSSCNVHVLGRQRRQTQSQESDRSKSRK